MKKNKIWIWKKLTRNKNVHIYNNNNNIRLFFK